ncbi:Helix-turn-helix domain-containing protein [Sinosporangium album]|uniref:Helix-turn-helix domain-containing protein n=1 Tax=Sinosporangium album TaxID=504805 RepID=A0A1G8FNL5_9ACTN|nr:helix-turn-helix transcriptional regulator [Sinosporangium album]SDH83674.1 Helix-turn-helix domain-containing protein [Sinosporangium album]
MPAPIELDPTTSPLAFFGAELRKCRVRAGLSQEQLAERIAFSPSLVGFIERAQRMPSEDFVARCDEALGLSGELHRLWPLISRESSPPWFREWLEVEEKAHTLRAWEPLVVPGLLQTEDYARAVIRGEPGLPEEQVEKAVTARLERQKILSRTDPPMLWVILDEGVLHRPVGGRAVMRQAVEHLHQVAESPRVAIQVVPLAIGATTGITGGFVIAQLPESTDVVYFESAGQPQVSERATDVKAGHARYDAIRAEAHPVHVSMSMIREAVKAWN